MEIDQERLEDQVDAYSRDELPVYEVYAKLLKMVFKHACMKYEFLGIVDSRAKTIPSFAEKVIRKAEKYDDPIHQLTDLCGARVITNTQQECDRIISFIRENFRIDEENSIDLRTLLKAEEFGYRSVHYVIQLRRDSEEINEVIREFVSSGGLVGSDPGLIGEDGISVGDIHDLIGERKAEIQVRTLLQHAWAMISHDRFYKSQFEVPEYFRRELARVAALLESADEEFGNAINGIDAYKMNYGSYMSRPQILEEVEKWEMVLTYDESNVHLAHGIASLSIAMEDWERALRVLEPFRDSDRGFIFRDFGIALTRAGKDGRKELERAVELEPEDAIAWCALGDAWKEIDGGVALKYYKQAFDRSPADPHILGSYLDARLRLSNTIDFVPLMYPTLKAAIETCEKLADAHVYLPGAFFDIARFSLLLNRPYDCLNALTKAVTLSDSVLPVRQAMESMTFLEGPIRMSAAT
jgi:ppGpp synthetase/RelA/SpoT-type nucleotidyltranferase